MTADVRRHGILAALYGREKTGADNSLNHYRSQLTWLANLEQLPECRRFPRTLGQRSSEHRPLRSVSRSDEKVFCRWRGNRTSLETLRTGDEHSRRNKQRRKISTNALRIKNRQLLVPLLQTTFQQETPQLGWKIAAARKFPRPNPTQSCA